MNLNLKFFPETVPGFRQPAGRADAALDDGVARRDGRVLALAAGPPGRGQYLTHLRGTRAPAIQMAVQHRGNS